MQLPINKTDLLARFQFQQPATVIMPDTTAMQKQLRHAAVLIALTETKHGLAILLTTRAAHLHHHAGQISFPGGKVEPTDTNLAATAMREAHEEIGLDPALIEVIGQLPAHLTLTRFNITPIIGYVNAPFSANIDHNEVANVFSVPLDFLLKPENRQQLKLKFKGQTSTLIAIKYNQHFIWGATASIIDNFCRHLNYKFT